MRFDINLDRSRQIALLILFLAVVGIAAIHFAIIDIEPIELKIGSIEESMTGRLVKITGRIENIRKSSSGNIYWTVDDGNNITVPIFDGKLKKVVAKRSDIVEITGLVSQYKGELEIMPKNITIR